MYSCSRLARRSLISFVTLASVGALVAQGGGEAAALQRRVSAAACFVPRAHTAQAEFGYSSSVYGLNNALNTNPSLSVQCPMPDDTYFPKTSVAYVNVHGYDPASTVQACAYACVTYWGTNGGTCGDIKCSGNAFVGDYTVSPPLTAWTTAYANDFAYLRVGVGQTSTSAPRGTIRGFFLSD